jgi:hypothetical protein
MLDDESVEILVLWNVPVQLGNAVSRNAVRVVLIRIGYKELCLLSCNAA